MADNCIRVTIDTNLINLKKKSDVLNVLEGLHQKGVIQMVATERLYMETKNYIEDAFQKAQTLDYVSEPFVVGLSRIGHAFVAKEELPSFREVASILFPMKNFSELLENQKNDVMHLLSHIESGADYFLTDNVKDFIEDRRYPRKNEIKREALKKLGIEVLTPEEFLSRVTVPL